MLEEHAQCDATVVTPSAPTFKALIEIHQPLQGSSYIVRIDRV